MRQPAHHGPGVAPGPDIIEAAGGVGFGCLQMVPDDDVLAKTAKMDVSKNLSDNDLRIPPILRYLHPKLSGSAYAKCCKDRYSCTKLPLCVNHAT